MGLKTGNSLIMWWIWLIHQKRKILRDKHTNKYAYICNHENNVTSRLSPKWLCGNSCTWAHHVRGSTLCVMDHLRPPTYTNIYLYIKVVITVHHVPKSMSCHNAIVVTTESAYLESKNLSSKWIPYISANSATHPWLTQNINSKTLVWRLMKGIPRN